MSGVAAFDRLHPGVRRWIRDQGWSELRDIQDRAIGEILNHRRDVVIMAATAGGKTEAAFLPLLGPIADREAGGGISVLYVSPLKALINDQFRRLDDLCEQLEIPVVRWHGDAPRSAKTRTLRDPAGIALITPESIEALFLRRSSDVVRLLGKLDAIVVDELHAFLQGPRGLHLGSLLRRIDALGPVRPRRIGLSATIGDIAAARRWLNPADPDAVAAVESRERGAELRLQIRGYGEPPAATGGDQLEEDSAATAKDGSTAVAPGDGLGRIADHLFAKLRGDNNLVFAGSRRTVEALSDRLRLRSDRAGVPLEFLPHHGSLSKELRETLETRLKAGDLPTTAIATTTLELGIDLGSVISVAQIGAPRSLSGLRQRLGRSGRREGSPSILRVYVRERHLAADADPLDRLRANTIRAVASVRLLLQGFVEPPEPDAALATVVLHQTLSVIAQTGGALANVLHPLLCGPQAPLPMSVAHYVELLRGVAADDVALIEQAPDGLLMLGAQGERLVAAKDFYAVFATDEEWRLVAGGRTLGTLPVSNMLGVGSLLAFAGRRWRIAVVHDPSKVLEVAPHPAGILPRFEPATGEPIHDRLAAEMRAVYLADDEPAYLDATARGFLGEGRRAFRAIGLERSLLVPSGADLHVVLWKGSVMNGLLAVFLASLGLECEANDLGVTIADCDEARLQTALAKAGNCPPMDMLAAHVENLRTAKLDEHVPEALLRRLWARRHEQRRVELDAAIATLRA